MIASGGGRPREGRDLRRPAELTHHHHEGGVEQAAVIEVLNEGGDHLLEISSLPLERGEDVRVMVPAAVVDGHKRDPRLDQSAGQQGLLTEGVAAVGVADGVGLAFDLEGPQGDLGGHQRDRLLVVLVGAQHRVARGAVLEPGELVKLVADLPAVANPPVIEPLGHGHVTDAEALAVGVVRNNKRSVPGSQEVRPPRAGDAGEREVRRQVVRGAAFGRDHRPHAGMEAHKRPTAHRNAGGGPGHHVVVARSVVVLVVADRTQNGELVADRRQPLHVLREMHPGDLGCDGLVLAPDLRGGGRLGVEHLDVAGATIQPDQDATGVPFLAPRFSAGLQGGNQAPSEQGPQAEAQAVATPHPLAVLVNRHGRHILSNRQR